MMADAPARYATPRHPERATRGPEVAVLAAAKGKPLMPHQRQIVDVALEIDPDTGLYWYDTVIVTIPRQSGKTKLVGDVADHRCLSLPGAKVWYTAQTGKDASQWMREDYLPTLDACPAYAGKFTTRRSAGSEAVVWPDLGSAFRVFPPQRDALHGKQVDLAFLDEYWAHDADRGAALKQAVRPAMSTRAGAQVWILSTQGDDQSVGLAEYTEIGRAATTDPTSRVAYFEWSIPEEADAEDLSVILAHHPAYGHTMTREALEAARVDFGTDVAGWARAFGNRATHSRVAAFPAEVWQDCGTELFPDQPERFGLAFDVAPDGSRTTVAAVWRDQGLVMAEILRDDPGSGWAAEYVAALARKYRVPVGYDTAGVHTLTVADELARNHRGVKLRGLTTVEFATSCASLAAVVLGRTFRHSRQPALDSAVACASRRPILDGGWGWGRKVSTGSITGLVAVTVALRMADDLPRKRSMRVITAAAS